LNARLACGATIVAWRSRPPNAIGQSSTISPLDSAEELVLITGGRKTGREHRVRLWFARDEDALWLRTDSGTRHGPDWYRNLVADPRCRVLVDGEEVEAAYEPSQDLEADLKRLVTLWRAKYGAMWVQDWYVEKGRVPVRLRLATARSR
jgi:hypothetical protein